MMLLSFVIATNVAPIGVQIERSIIENYSKEELKNEKIEIIKAEDIWKEKPKLLEQKVIKVEIIEKKYETKSVPEHNPFKSYMSYKTITNKTSKQYELQQIAETGDYGIRIVNNRFCIALGSYFTTEIGTEIDIIMENGSVLECILADCKDDKHTDESNIIAADGSILEFIVDLDELHMESKYHGDMSYCSDDFQGEILEIKIYNKGEK